MQCPHCNSSNTQRRGTHQEGRSQRLLCHDCRQKNGGRGGYYVVSIDLRAEPNFILSDTKVRQIEKGRCFIVTSAMNNTNLDKKFWQALRHFSERNGHKRVVVPVQYRNPKSPLEAEETERDLWWPEEIQGYAVDNEVQVHEQLWIMGDHKVQATAVNPLMGKEPLSRGASAIYGHSQIAMQTIPTLQHLLPKILHTTGSTSLDNNYSRSDRGARAKFHHSLGAVIIEKEGPRFHLRVVVGDRSGAFYDMGRRYHADGVGKFERAEALVCGDSHSWFHDPHVREATYDADDSITQTLRPKVRVLHDVLDAYSVNPWHRRDPVIQYAKHQSGHNDVRAELEATLRFIEETTPKDCKNVVVASNHHDFLYRWLRDMDPKHDPRNAIVYHELMLACLRQAEVTEHGVEQFDPFAEWARERIKVPTEFLSRWDSLLIKAIEVALHGDAGSGGFRGSAAGFSKIGAKSVIAHAHSPRIVRGCYQVGCSQVLPEEYQRGPTSALHTHCVIWPNGKRQLLNVIVSGSSGGHWRG